jgi:uncharacterized protein YidB (DUF937 family)
MLALLGLLAVAGYQNRDKISGALNDLKSRSGTSADGTPDILSGLANGLSGLLNGQGGGGLGGLLGGLGGGGLAGGLNDLLGTFKDNGQADVADSWVNPSVPTQGLRPDQVEAAIGSDTLAELSTRTGLSREELLERLAKNIPQAVDALTPNGQMPTEEQLRERLLPAA